MSTLIHKPIDFTWPLTAEGVRMSSIDLLDEVVAAVRVCNVSHRWPRIIEIPELGDLRIDRENKTITAHCRWAWKPGRDGYALTH